MLYPNSNMQYLSSNIQYPNSNMQYLNSNMQSRYQLKRPRLVVRLMTSWVALALRPHHFALSDCHHLECKETNTAKFSTYAHLLEFSSIIFLN